MSSSASEMPFVEDDAWHEPAQSLERTESPLPPGFAVEIVVDKIINSSTNATLNLIQSLLGMNDNPTPIKPTISNIMLNTSPAVSLGPGDSGTRFVLISIDVDVPMPSS